MSCRNHLFEEYYFHQSIFFLLGKDGPLQIVCQKQNEMYRVILLMINVYGYTIDDQCIWLTAKKSMQVICHLSGQVDAMKPISSRYLG